MALKKKEEAPKGSPAWMSTFSDLMNLLLCFFVLLYSMSTVNEEKFQQVIASLSRSMSILPAGGASIGEGEMISSGVRQLEFLDTYYNEMANSESEEDTDDTDIVEAYREEELSESEEMAQQLEEALQGSGLQDLVEVDFNAEYVQLSLSGALLFESGSSEIPEDAYPIMDKISAILEQYDSNIIEIEGHTDNVPMYSEKYEDNDVLSMYRALTIANYVRDHSTLNPAYVKSSGRGDYVPIADNSTEEGRARNRRVEIKIYNSYNSDL
jgi:chemotaxis protein MotB